MPESQCRFVHWPAWMLVLSAPKFRNGGGGGGGVKVAVGGSGVNVAEGGCGVNVVVTVLLVGVRVGVGETVGVCVGLTVGVRVDVDDGLPVLFGADVLDGLGVVVA